MIRIASDCFTTVAAIVLKVGIDIVASGIILLHTFWWLYFFRIIFGSHEL